MLSKGFDENTDADVAYTLESGHTYKMKLIIQFAC